MGRFALFLRRSAIPGLAVLALSVAGSDARASGLYRLTDLGVGSVVGVNDLGQVLMNTPTGSYIQTGDTRVQISTRGAYGFNNKGQVLLAHHDPSDPEVKAVIWDNGRETPLRFQPTSINNKGEVSGWKAFDPSTTESYSYGVYRAVLYKDGREIDLLTEYGFLGGGIVFGSSAIKVNDRGQVVGNAIYDGNWAIPPNGFVSNIKNEIKIPVTKAQTMSGSADNYLLEINSINDLGAYTGTLRPIYNGPTRLYNVIGYADEVYDAYSEAILYGFPFPDGDTEAVDINNSGLVLAYREPFELDDPYYQPIQSGAWVGGLGWWDNLYDLLTDDTRPSWGLVTPVDLSNSGHIVGSTRVDGENRMWLLTPVGFNPPPPIPAVPEPGTWILAISALPVTIGWIRRQRREKA